MNALPFIALMLGAGGFVWWTLSRVNDRARQRVAEGALTAHLTQIYGPRVLSDEFENMPPGQLAHMIDLADEYGCRDVARKLRRDQARLAKR